MTLRAGIMKSCQSSLENNGKRVVDIGGKSGQRVVGSGGERGRLRVRKVGDTE